MKLVNYDASHTDGGSSKPCKGKQLPFSLPNRVLIVGPSGCGKTNLLLNLIYNILPWDNLYVFARDLSEPKYKMMQEDMEMAEEMYDLPPTVHFNTDLTLDGEPFTVDDLESNTGTNIVVFDDFITADRKTMSNIVDFFVRGRKRNATVFFLTQSYFDLPKCLRLQGQYLIFFRQRDDRHLNEIYRNHNCGFTNKADFVQLFQNAVQNFGFLTINQTTGQVGANFDQHYKSF